MCFINISKGDINTYGECFSSIIFQHEAHSQQYLTSGKDRFTNDQNVNSDIYITNKSDIQTDKTNQEKERWSYMELNRSGKYLFNIF